MLGATTGPPATLGAPVSYGNGGAGAGAADGAVTLILVGVLGFGRGLRLAATVMVGSVALPGCAAGAAGVLATGGASGDARSGTGAVCARAIVQQIRKTATNANRRTAAPAIATRRQPWSRAARYDAAQSRERDRRVVIASGTSFLEAGMTMSINHHTEIIA